MTAAGRALRVAVILPCHNEGEAIGRVVRDFRVALPDAEIHVFDNNSTDDTVERALEAGARVIREPRQGKGNVMRRAFAEIDADVYVTADGDGTYDAARAPEMVRLLVEDRLDMVVGVRRDTAPGAYRQGHRVGNSMFNLLFRYSFGAQFTDILSGYRVFSRRFVKSFAALSSGFEIETEMSVHALQLRLPTAEIETDYCERIEGTTSKLRTYRDGLRILLRILLLLKRLRPSLLFGVLALAFSLLSLALGLPIVFEFIETGLVPRFPTAFAAASLMVMALISVTTGLVLDTVAYAHREAKRLHYLTIPKYAAAVVVDCEDAGR